MRDMQIQNHINIQWPRCGDEISISGRSIRCDLDYQAAYDLLTAYRKAPHALFLNMKTDADLVDFLKRFGPLYLDRQDGSPVGSADVYWKFQQWLKRLLQLIAALKKNRGVRMNLLTFLEADIEWHRVNRGYRLRAPATLALARLTATRYAGQTASMSQWLETAPDPAIREGAATTIRMSICFEGRLQVVLGRHRAELFAAPTFRSLGDALEWMCWRDEQRERPMFFCIECGKAVFPDTAHERKYCGPKCAHRATGRNWSRRDRARKKATERNEERER